MSMRVVLVPLFDTRGDPAAVHAAGHVARRFEGRIIGLFVRPDPTDVLPYVVEGVTPTILAELIRKVNEATELRRAEAQRHFSAACGTVSIPVVEEAPTGATGCIAQWEEVVGRREEVVPVRARLADLTIFGWDREESDFERRRSSSRRTCW